MGLSDDEAQHAETPPLVQVIITPSSPGIQNTSPTIANSFVPLFSSSLYPEYAMQRAQDEDEAIALSDEHAIDTNQLPPSRFDELLANSDMPDPGPAYFKARRALWLTPIERTSPQRPRPMHPNLQALLDGPTESLYEESNWNGGVGKICQRLLSGERLSNRLPLRHVVCLFRSAHLSGDGKGLIPTRQIKLLHASWVLGDLWPKGQVVPSSDEDVSRVESNEVTSR